MTLALYRSRVRSSELLGRIRPRFKQEPRPIPSRLGKVLEIEKLSRNRCGASRVARFGEEIVGHDDEAFETNRTGSIDRNGGPIEVVVPLKVEITTKVDSKHSASLMCDLKAAELYVVMSGQIKRCLEQFTLR